MFPFYVEFSIISISFLYRIYSNVGTRPEHKQVKLMDPKHLHLLRHTSCAGSHLGLILGYLFMTFIIALTIYYNLLQNNTISSNLASVDLYFGINIGINIVALIGISVAIYHLRKFHFVPDTNILFDEILLTISLAGHYFLMGFIIVAAFVSINNPDYSKYSILYIVFAIISYIQGTLQVVALRDGLRRRIILRKYLEQTPGRSTIGFLIPLNLGMWIVNSFMLKQISGSFIMIDVYGRLAWVIVSSIFLPLDIFFRFHSGACFADIYECTYYQDCYICGRNITVGNWEVNTRSSHVKYEE